MRRVGENKDLNLDNFAWKNEDAEVVKQLTCFVPKKIHNVVRSANSVLKGDEFSFLLKCDIDWENGIVHISEDWYFPEQIVTAASVNYKEDMSEYNGVMHKHPGKMRNFSGTDDEWINQNFQVSILWIDDEFCNGRINVPSPAGRIQLPLVVVEEADFEVMEDVVAIVKEKASKPKYVAPINVKKQNGLAQNYSQTSMWGSGAANNFQTGGGSHPLCNPNRLVEDDFEDDIFIIDGEEVAAMSDDAFAFACAESGCLEGFNELEWLDDLRDPFHVDETGDSLNKDTEE